MTEHRAVVAFVGRRIVLFDGPDGLHLPALAEFGDHVDAAILDAARVDVSVRDHEGRAVQVFGFPEDADLPEPFRLDGLRVAWNALSLDQFRVAGAARQKLDWVRTHRFCSRCGATTRPDETHEAMACPECSQLHYARIAPAVIVLVQRGSEALLGRSHHFKEGVYSTLAGFVEAGESLEECVHREIAEEVGVQVENLRYFGSQPHPFPHSLMVGFIADWKEGEIRIDPAEIDDARWFTADALPNRPHPRSIARALIDDFVRRVSE